MDTIHYILISTACLSAFYTAYMLLFRYETNFRQLRFYLLASILLSIAIPLSRFEIKMELPKAARFLETAVVEQPEVQPNTTNFNSPKEAPSKEITTKTPATSPIDWTKAITKLYFLVSLALLSRILWQIGGIVSLYLRSRRTRVDSYVIIENNKGTFSFFNWIFIKTERADPKEVDQLILHEKIHASQYHSFDTLLIELLAAVMWFNPIVWMMRNTVKLVHEYLADEGVLQTGINRLGYQALLINQITEEKLICISSSFNCSIKKRMIMMNKSNFKQKTKLRILALIPLGLCLFAGVAFVNGQTKSNIEPRKQEVPNKPFTVIIVTDGMSSKGMDDKQNNLAIAELLKAKSTNDLRITIRKTDQADKNEKFDLLIMMGLSKSSESSKSKIICTRIRHKEDNEINAKFKEVFTSELSQIPNLVVKPGIGKASVVLDSKDKRKIGPVKYFDDIYLTAENNTSFFSKKENQQLVCDKIINAINKFRSN